MKLDQANKAALIGTGIRIGLPIIGIGIGILLIRKLFRRNPDGTSAGAPPSMKEMAINTSKLTIAPSDAALFANTLYGAMQEYGTDEGTIYSIMDKVVTKDDMLLVIKAFGMKKYLWGTRGLWLGQEYNLIGWLRAELTGEEIGRIKPKFDGWGIPL